MYKYKVTLKHIPNPDIEYANGNGYWGYPKDKKEITIGANTLRDIQDKFFEWRSRNDLGGGNLPYTYIRDTENNKIAHISYNCRIWDMDGNEIKKEL